MLSMGVSALSRNPTLSWGGGIGPGAVTEGVLFTCGHIRSECPRLVGALPAERGIGTGRADPTAPGPTHAKRCFSRGAVTVYGTGPARREAGSSNPDGARLDPFECRRHGIDDLAVESDVGVPIGPDHQDPGAIGCGRHCRGQGVGPIHSDGRNAERP